MMISFRAPIIKKIVLIVMMAILVVVVVVQVVVPVVVRGLTWTMCPPDSHRRMRGTHTHNPFINTRYT